MRAKIDPLHSGSPKRCPPCSPQCYATGFIRGFHRHLRDCCKAIHKTTGKIENSKIITTEYLFLRFCTPGHQLSCKFRFISAQSVFLHKWLKYNGFVLFVTNFSCLVFYVDHASTYMNLVAISQTCQVSEKGDNKVPEPCRSIAVNEG